MKVTFVRPDIMELRSSDAMEPLVFARLAGLTPPDVETVLYDEHVEQIDFKSQASSGSVAFLW